jgi:hypothetical protein
VAELRFRQPECKHCYKLLISLVVGGVAPPSGGWCFSRKSKANLMPVWSEAFDVEAELTVETRFSLRFPSLLRGAGMGSRQLPSKTEIQLKP